MIKQWRRNVKTRKIKLEEALENLYHENGKTRPAKFWLNPGLRRRSKEKH